MSPPHIAIAALCMDAQVNTELQSQLSQVGVGVVWARSPLRLTELVRLGGISLILIDIGDAFVGDEQVMLDWVASFREISTIPLLMVHRGLGETIRVNLLDAGVDLLIDQTVTGRERASLIRAQLRRATYYLVKPLHDSWHEANFDQLNFNLKSRVISGEGSEVRLTEKEARLLVALLRRPGEVVHRRLLAPEVTGRPWNPTERALDVHATHLRQKLTHAGGKDGMVGTVRGVGYRIDATPTWA